MLTRVIADAVADGLLARSNSKSSNKDEEGQPLADWEREILEGSEGKEEAKAEESESAAKGEESKSETPAADAASAK